MDLTIKHRSVNELVPYARNARMHSQVQVTQIADSISEFGFVNPVLISEDKEIIAGHGRVLAAKQLGLETVPTILLAHLTEVQRHALIIADNKLAENASWDDVLLSSELKYLDEQDFNLELLGFSDVDLDSLLSDFDDKLTETDETEEVIPETKSEPISKQGDIWLLGDHRLLCGDATSSQVFKSLMDDEIADMVFTDPPYNVNYSDSSNTSRSYSGGRTILNDKLGNNFEQFITTACTHMLNYTRGAFYICMSFSEIETLKRAFVDAGGQWSTFIIWVKEQGVLGGSDYQRQYEPILYGWRRRSEHYWCGKRDQSNVWFHNKLRKNELHPTMKPVDLVMHAIKNSSRKHDIVLDPFAGSGTTLIAAEKLGRCARLIELDPIYVDTIVERWQNLTGKTAYHKQTGQTYVSISSNRKS